MTTSVWNAVRRGRRRRPDEVGEVGEDDSALACTAGRQRGLPARDDGQIGVMTSSGCRGRRRPSLLTTVASGALVITVGALSACSATTSSQPEDLWIGPTQVAGISTLGDGWSDVDDGLLVTPTLAVQVDQVKRADGLSPKDCEVLPCDAAGAAVADVAQDGITAADGHDLVAVVLRAPLRGAPYASVVDEAGTAIAIGGHDVSTSELTQVQIGSPAAIILSVPDETESLDLSVTLTDRTMTLDLLSGRPADDADTALVAPLSEVMPQLIDPNPYAASGRMRVAAGGSALRFPFGYEWSFADQIVWTPWLPSSGWAEDGRAWITLDQVSVRTTTPERDLRGLLYPRATVDLRASWSLTPDGGGPIRPDAPIVDLSGDTASTTDLVWQVPAGTTSGSLGLDTVGSLEVYLDDDPDFEPRSPRWTREPEPLELDVDFTTAPTS